MVLNMVRAVVVGSLILLLAYEPAYDWINSSALNLAIVLVVYSALMVRLFPGIEDTPTMWHITLDDLRRWTGRPAGPSQSDEERL